MEQLACFLKEHSYRPADVRIIGDQVNLNDELVLAYDHHYARYLAGLQPRATVCRELLTQGRDKQFYDPPFDSRE